MGFFLYAATWATSSKYVFDKGFLASGGDHFMLKAIIFRPVPDYMSCASDLRFAAAVEKLVLLVQIGGGRAGPAGYRPGPLSCHQPRLSRKQACVESV